MLKKTLCHTVNVLSTMVILLAVFVLLSVLLTERGQVPQVLGYSAFRVLTGSMEPQIREQDLILVRRTEPESVQVGDVITFYSADPALGGAVNTHRVTAISQDAHGVSFTTKGDANLIEDRYAVRETDLIGVVVWRSMLLGRLTGLVSNPLVFLPLVFLPLAAILIVNLLRTVRLAKQAVLEEEAEALRLLSQESKQRDGKQD